MLKPGISRRVSTWISASLVAGFFSVLPFATAPAQAWTTPTPSSITFGSTGNDNALGVDTDPSGNIYTVGSFVGTVDFDPSPALFNLTARGSQDGFVTKFDPSGNFLWAKSIGAAGNSVAVNGVTVGDAGNVYIAGQFRGTVYINSSDTSTGVFTSTTHAGFFAEFSTVGNYLWSKSIAGTGDAPAVAIALDSANNSIYIAGRMIGQIFFNSSDTSTNSVTSTGSDTNIYLAKYSTTGTYAWANAYSGNGSAKVVNRVAVDGSGNVYIAGQNYGTINFTPSTGSLPHSVTAGQVDPFIAKFNSQGLNIWAHAFNRVPSNGNVFANGMTVDNDGNVYVTGVFSASLNLNPLTGTATITTRGGASQFLVKMDTNRSVLWGKVIGGTAPGSTSGREVTVDASGNVYTTGTFSGTTYFNADDTSTGVLTSATQAMFISKYNSSGNYTWANMVRGTGAVAANSITVAANGSVFAAGQFAGTVSLGSTACPVSIVSKGSNDLLVYGLDRNGFQFPVGPPVFDTLTVTSGFTTGGTTTRFNGLNLWCTNYVAVGGAAAAYAVISDTSVSLTTPVGVEGLRDVILTTLTGVATADASFRYIGRYKVTYDRNTASGTQASETYTAGTPLTLPVTTTFTKTGFTFGGWGATSDTTTRVTTYSTSAPVTFYAIWTPNQYSVTFNANRVGATGAMATETRTAPTNLPPNAFTAAGRSFRYWTTQANGGGVRYSDGAQYAYIASTTLYAQWGVTVTYSSLGADSGSPSRTSDLVDTSTLTLPTVGTMVKPGYTFGGWSNGVTTYTTSYTPSANITLNPVWNPKTYTVSFNKNGVTRSGTVPGNQTWLESTTPLTLSGNTGSLVRDGYTFGGWATSANAPQTPITTYATTSETLTQTLYAVWTPISYSVTYQLNNGDGTAPTQASRYANETFTVAARPTRSGYQFADWFDGKSGYDANATYRVETSTVTLTARWVPVYTLHYTLNGSSDTPEADTTAVGGTVVQLAAAPTRPGYTFTGWLGRNNTLLPASDTFTIVEDSNMIAQWTAISRSVTYNTAGASSDTPTVTSKIINDSFSLASAPTRAGYLFDGWFDGTDLYGAQANYVVSLSNVILTAQWTAIAYTVTYDLGGGYLATPPTKSDVNIGNTFNLYNGTDPELAVHTFTGWSDGTATYAKNALYTAGSKNIVLTAQYSLNGYTGITYAAGSGGTGTPPANVSQLEGTTFIVESATALSRTGYAFNGWFDGTYSYQPGDTFYVGPVGSPVTLTAQWILGYAVTYLPGSGSGTVPTDSNSYITNSTFILPGASMLSQSGYTFAGWNDGSATYQAGALYTVASTAITLTAQWNLIPPPPSQNPVREPQITKVEKEVVEALNPRTPITTAIVAEQVAIASNRESSNKLFADLPKESAKTSAISMPKASEIQAVSDGKRINSVVAHINSATKATISLPATNLVLSDFVVEKFQKQAIVAATENGITVTPVNGFTGILVVPTAATINGEVVIVLNKVVVNPLAPVAIGFAPIDINRSSISWTPSPSQVTSYQITINGKKACETTKSSCPIPSLIGPKSKVTITAIGNDQTASEPVLIPYAVTAPIPALKVNFATGSSILSKAQKAEITALSKVISKQGFTRLVVNGFTDSRGSQALNAKLSQARALAVARYMQPLLPSIKVKASAFGTKNPVASNANPDGRAQNRRTEISTW